MTSSRASCHFVRGAAWAMSRGHRDRSGVHSALEYQALLFAAEGEPPATPHTSATPLELGLHGRIGRRVRGGYLRFGGCNDL